MTTKKQTLMIYGVKSTIEEEKMTCKGSERRNREGKLEHNSINNV